MAIKIKKFTSLSNDQSSEIMLSSAFIKSLVATNDFYFIIFHLMILISGSLCKLGYIKC